MAKSIMVVMDANRSEGNVEAVDWALNYVVRPRDTLTVLGVLHELRKKPPASSCFIRLKLEFTGDGELDLRELKEEIAQKREQYKRILQPFYHQCKKKEANFVIKIAAGFDPRKITIDEAQSSNTQFIVLDSHFKKVKEYIFGHVSCGLAVKEKDVVSLLLRKAHDPKLFPITLRENDKEKLDSILKNNPSSTLPTGRPCWDPLAWQKGFPRAFSLGELEEITNAYADENILSRNIKKGKNVYQGILQETPVLVKCYSGEDDGEFWSALNILLRVRHHNIMNLVGYCIDSPPFCLLYDHPCNHTIAMNLEGDESAKNLTWKARRSIALEIGGCVRYLHEECADGPIVGLSVCSSCIVLSHCGSPMLGSLEKARSLKDCSSLWNEASPTKCLTLEEREQLFADVQNYGEFLLELITGKNVEYSFQSERKTLVDWALPFLESGSLSQIKDPRLVEDCDDLVVTHMASAALHCLRNNSNDRSSMSRVLEVIQG